MLHLENLINEIELGKAEEHFSGVELKQSWQLRHGEDISAIANELNLKKGWLIVGLDDKGNSRKNADANWAKKEEETISNHIREKLSPYWAVKSITVHKVKNSECIFIEIVSPDEIVRWNDKAYKLIGTTSSEMKPHEVLNISLKLPGSDFSKNSYLGKVDPALIVNFAKKVIESTGDEFGIDINKMSSEEILQRLNIFNTQSAGILFGEFKCRLVHFNSNGDILDQNERLGLYNILNDQFIEDIQSWTRKEGTVIRGSSVPAPEELP